MVGFHGGYGSAATPGKAEAFHKNPPKTGHHRLPVAGRGANPWEPAPDAGVEYLTHPRDPRTRRRTRHPHLSQGVQLARQGR
ncbi:hypothetical protein ABH917_000612 [Thermobifida halotolerans]